MSPARANSIEYSLLLFPFSPQSLFYSLNHFVSFSSLSLCHIVSLSLVFSFSFRVCVEAYEKVLQDRVEETFVESTMLEHLKKARATCSTCIAPDNALQVL